MLYERHHQHSVSGGASGGVVVAGFGIGMVWVAGYCIGYGADQISINREGTCAFIILCAVNYKIVGTTIT